MAAVQGRGLLPAVVAALVLALAPAAQALPGDATFAATAPADGAQLPADLDGIPVAFSCPVYRVFDDGFIPLYGGPKDYGVSFSRSTTVGPDGRLSDPVALGTGSVPAGYPQDSCVSAMNPGGSRPLPQETPGTYYWQVWRICTGCAGSYEVGPILHFTIKSPAQMAVRSPAPARAFAGYPIAFPLTLSGVPDGTKVRLERKAGAAWKTVGTATALGEKGEAIAVLPKGTQRLRLTAVIGDETVTSSERQVAVRAAKGWLTDADDAGRYTGKAGSRSVKLTVSPNGRELRQFSAFVAMLCPGITPGTFTTQIGTALVPKARLDPDGRFIAALTPGKDTAVRIRGRVLNGKVVQGRAELSVGTCSGSTAFSAQHAH
jgi:hypothetical protein